MKATSDKCFRAWPSPLRDPGATPSLSNRGVDVLLYFYESTDERRKIIVQVKGGDVNNQKAAGGILLSVSIRPFTRK